MGLTYFKRYRMEVSLANRELPQPVLPRGYSWSAWDESLLEAHAETKYLSFRSEIDANVFPCLGELAGCYRLMNEIRHKDGFLPEATWLLAHREGPVPRRSFAARSRGFAIRPAWGRSRIWA